MIALDADGWMQLAIDRHNRIIELATELNKARDEIEAMRVEAKRQQDGLHEMLRRANKEITRLKKEARNG